MNDIVIAVEKLSKCYLIGHQRDSRDALRHRIEDAFRNPVKWLREKKRNLSGGAEEFWALKDVTFSVKQGEVVGIIGRNGAGKSTLLKILSQITEPTAGRIRILGRVASLLEVGTGFHQELTGRENIFLNGAILGMARQEIKRKFDEIVAFSEVEKFLDTPVKRYSSGMYVRLAFAVAAHLEPDILIIDEVLAVGDAAFQKKCLGKMGEVARGGRTVLFVSHNMSAVQSLCNKGVYMQGGTVKSLGDIEPVMSQYLSDTGTAQGRNFGDGVMLGKTLKLTTFEFTPHSVVSGDPVRFTLKLRAEAAVTISDLSLLIYSLQSVRVANLDFRAYGIPVKLAVGQELVINGEIRSLPLVEGDYSAGLYINMTDFLENVFDLTTFTVLTRPSNSAHTPYPVVYRGLVELDYTAGVRTSQ